MLPTDYPFRNYIPIFLFCFVYFYGISTIVGYAISNLLYTYIKIYMIDAPILLIMFLNESKLILFLIYGSKYCDVSLTIKQQLFVCIELNELSVIFLTIQFRISHFLHSI